MRLNDHILIMPIIKAQIYLLMSRLDLLKTPSTSRSI